MGDRANVGIRSCGEEVWLYTHWLGSDLPEIVAAALDKGRDRWDQAEYLARIVFQAMLGEDKGNTGFGIWTSPPDNEHDLIVLDVDAQLVLTFKASSRDHKPVGGPKTSRTFKQVADGAKVAQAGK